MLAAGSGVGAPAGFLARISCLEREISFLKQKVEDDARWKHILQQWVLDNFAFDIQGALLHGNQRSYQSSSATYNTTTPASARARSGTSTPAKSARKTSSPSQIYRKVKVEQAEPMRTRYQGSGSGISYHQEDEDDISPAGFMDDEDEDNEMEQVHCFGGVMEDGMEVNVHPKDLIITPDICADTSRNEGQNAVVNANRGGSSKTSRTTRTKRKDSLLEDTDNEDTLGEVAGDADVNKSDGDSSSSEEELQRRPHRKMEWTLIANYSNVNVMKQQFNLREWGLSTKQVSDSGTKIYYYCKECRKHGPGRLLIRYENENGEVQVLKNQLQHDHSTKKRLTEEMKVEIVNLFKAGIIDSPKILAALKISKPHMRQPSVKQICHILKPFRQVERKHKLKEKKKALKEKEKQKLTNSLMDLTTGGGKKPRKRNKKEDGDKNESMASTLPQFSLPPSTLVPTSSNSTLNPNPQLQNLGQFMATGSDDRSREFQRPHIVSVTGFPTPSQQQQLQQFYQQQQHSSFDPSNNPSAHLGQHYP